MAITPDIGGDAELKKRIRSTTLYADDEYEGVEGDRIDDYIRNAKLQLANEGVQNFYADHGVQQALLYASVIEAKLAMENYSVTRWEIPAGNIDVSGAGNSAQAQFQQWAERVSRGLQQSDEVQGTRYPTSINSAGFIR